MQNRATILIVDDDMKTLDSLQRILQRHAYSVEMFSSAESVLAYEPPTGPCCAIINVKMPGRTGLELQASLAKAGLGLLAPVILITDYGNVADAVQAIKAGATDFLTKPVEAKRLLDAIKRALAQGWRLRNEQREKAVYGARFNTLTAREKEVCLFVVAGKLNKQIAAELGTSDKTIKVHRGRVMRKMKVESLAELVRVCFSIRNISMTSKGAPMAAPPVPSKGAVTRAETADSTNVAAIPTANAARCCVQTIGPGNSEML